MTPELVLDMKITVRTLLKLIGHAESLREMTIDKKTIKQMNKFIEGSKTAVIQIQTLVNSVEQGEKK